MAREPNLKRGRDADLPASARIITDETERRTVVQVACEAWNRLGQVEAFVAGSPVIEVDFDDPTLLTA